MRFHNFPKGQNSNSHSKEWLLWNREKPDLCWFVPATTCKSYMHTHKQTDTHTLLNKSLSQIVIMGRVVT